MEARLLEFTPRPIVLLEKRDPDPVAEAVAPGLRELRINAEGIAERGLLIRHLVMPGGLEETRSILHWIAANLSRCTYVNLMDQYQPAHRAAEFPELNRRLRRDEFASGMEMTRREGLIRLDTRSHCHLP